MAKQTNKPAGKKRGRPSKKEHVHIDVLASRKSTNKAKQEPETLGDAWSKVPKWLKVGIIVFLLLLVKECVFSKPDPCKCYAYWFDINSNYEFAQKCHDSYMSERHASRECAKK